MIFIFFGDSPIGFPSRPLTTTEFVSTVSFLVALGISIAVLVWGKKHRYAVSAALFAVSVGGYAYIGCRSTVAVAQSLVSRQNVRIFRGFHHTLLASGYIPGAATEESFFKDFKGEVSAGGLIYKLENWEKAKGTVTFRKGRLEPIADPNLGAKFLAWADVEYPTDDK